MPLTRRAFLRQTSLLLAGLGMSETAWAQYIRQYQQALAEPTSRKLALLVGINPYDRAALPPLKGCTTDLELQRELLKHRFGFHDRDILLLQDGQATRSQIESAYTDHLLNQAQSGDMVLFHFSGYGRYLRRQPPTDLQAPSQADHLYPALVPAPALSQTAALSLPEEGDLSLETLISWLRALRTDRITTVLDTGFVYPGSPLLGHLRVRSLPAAMLPWEGAVKPLSTRPPGVMLTAATASQTAMEAQWHDFAAGLFTYALTQQLWQSTPATSLAVHFNAVATALAHQVGVDTPFEWQGVQQKSHLQLSYGLPMGPPADGVVQATADTGAPATLWLAGLAPEVLEQSELTSCFQVLPPAPGEGTPTQPATISLPPTAVTPIRSHGSGPTYVRVQSHRGPKAMGTLLNPGQLQVGQRLQEAIRILPHSIVLNVALDPNLDRIERVDATSAFSEWSQIAPVVSGEQSADYLFTTIASTVPSDLASVAQPAAKESNTPAVDRYGLSYPAGVRLTSTQGEAGEAVKIAVRRLKPTLKALLAAKLLQLTVNPQSSRLGVHADLTIVPTSAEPTIALQQSTPRAAQFQSRSQGSEAVNLLGGVPRLAVGSRIRYRIHNQSERPCYWLLIGIDNSARVFALTPPNFVLPSTDRLDSIPVLYPGGINPGETITVPAEADNAWIIGRPVGLTTVYLICSRQPFSQTAKTLAAQLPRAVPAKTMEMVSLPAPLDVAQDLLQDLHEASSERVKAMGLAQDSTWALAVEDWATLPFVYYVEST
jgi:hypothetical protein